MVMRCDSCGAASPEGRTGACAYCGSQSAPVPVTAPAPAAAPEAPPVPATAYVVQENRPCLACGYSLQGLLVNDVCPECGTPIRRSLRGNLLEFASLDYLQSLARGANLVFIARIVAIVATFVSGGLVFALSTLGRSGTSPFASGKWTEIVPELVELGGDALILFGWWMLSAPDPAFAGNDTADKLRRWLRRLVVASFALGVVVLVSTTVSGFSRNAIGSLINSTGAASPSTIATLGVLVTFQLLKFGVEVALYFVSVAYIRNLAPRFPDMSLYEEAKRNLWLLPLLRTVGTLLLCAGPLVALILYLIMMHHLKVCLQGAISRAKAAALAGVEGVDLAVPVDLAVAGAVAPVPVGAAPQRTEPRTIPSIVMLRARAASISDERIEQVVRAVLGGSPEFRHETMAPGARVHVITASANEFFVIHDTGMPYFKGDPAAWAADIPDPQASRLAAMHRAFLCVDCMQTSRPEREMFRILGRIAADLLDDGCLVMYSTNLGTFAVPDADTPRVFREEHPLSEFPGYGVMLTPKDDPAITAQIAEARRRWPEFVSAYAAHASDGMFMVKGRFEHEGFVEHMWVKVTEFDGTTIRGSLGNKPFNIPNLSAGDTVTLTFERVSDWSATYAGYSEGMFTDPRMRAAIAAMGSKNP